MGQTTFSGPVASNNGFTAGSFTTTERNALTNVATGTLIFNSTDSEMQVYDGSAWVSAFAAGGTFVTPFSYSAAGGDYNNDTPGQEGISFAGDGNVSQDPAFLYANPISWSNTAGVNNLVLQPLGSSGTVTLPQGTFAYTTTTAWTLTGFGYYEVQVSGEVKNTIHGGGSGLAITG